MDSHFSVTRCGHVVNVGVRVKRKDRAVAGKLVFKLKLDFTLRPFMERACRIPESDEKVVVLKECSRNLLPGRGRDCTFRRAGRGRPQEALL